ncbi:hypothetical protein IIA15_11250, partial [candidate division TA06 bacterium]|nr:hypothetical protein [candidate division TA06 bacterium]
MAIRSVSLIILYLLLSPSSWAQTQSLDHYWLIAHRPDLTDVHIFSQTDAVVTFSDPLGPVGPSQSIPANTPTSLNLGTLGFSGDSNGLYYAEVNADQDILIAFERRRTDGVLMEDYGLARPKTILSNTWFDGVTQSFSGDDRLALFTTQTETIRFNFFLQNGSSGSVSRVVNGYATFHVRNDLGIGNNYSLIVSSASGRPFAYTNFDIGAGFFSLIGTQNELLNDYTHLYDDNLGIISFFTPTSN